MLEFELPYEYRSGSDEDIQNCSIGPNIIRKLLTETLNEEWSIAVYVPYHKEQMNTTDAQRSKDFEAWNGSDLNPELIRERQEWIYRAKELKHCDMRQFFRAGFQQVVDQTALKTRDFYITYVTADEITAAASVRTGKETMDIPITELVSSSDDTPTFQRSKKEQELFDFMKEKVFERKELVRGIDAMPRNSHDHPECRRSIDYFEEDLKNQRMYLQDKYKSCAIIPLSSKLFLKEEIAYCEGKLLHGEAGLQRLRSVWTNRCLDEVLEKEHELKTFDSNVRQQLLAIICSNNDGEASSVGDSMMTTKKLIIKSSMIHVCAYNHCREYAEMILSMFPSRKEWPAIMNSFDHTGHTPLMIGLSLHAAIYNPNCLSFGNFLLDAGSIRDVLNPNTGYTAYGIFRQSRHDLQHMDLMYGRGTAEERNAKTDIADALEQFLMPSTGPSDADRIVCEEIEDDDSDDEL